MERELEALRVTAAEYVALVAQYQALPMDARRGRLLPKIRDARVNYLSALKAFELALGIGDGSTAAEHAAGNAGIYLD